MGFESPTTLARGVDWDGELNRPCSTLSGEGAPSRAPAREVRDTQRRPQPGATLSSRLRPSASRRKGEGRENVGAVWEGLIGPNKGNGELTLSLRQARHEGGERQSLPRHSEGARRRKVLNLHSGELEEVAQRIQREIWSRGRERRTRERWCRVSGLPQDAVAAAARIARPW